MDAIFHALGDETRRAMLRMLAAGERSVGELSAPFPMTLAAASKHIKVLETAGLVQRDIRWRTHVCRLNAAPLQAAMAELAYYERFWTSRIDTLEQLLRDEDAGAKAPPDTEGERR
jgi:DNA-binding transcriptional ArsR family regulator